MSRIPAPGFCLCIMSPIVWVAAVGVSSRLSLAGISRGCFLRMFLAGCFLSNFRSCLMSLSRMCSHYGLCFLPLCFLMILFKISLPILATGGTALLRRGGTGCGAQQFRMSAMSGTMPSGNRESGREQPFDEKSRIWRMLEGAGSSIGGASGAGLSYSR